MLFTERQVCFKTAAVDVCFECFGILLLKLKAAFSPNFSQAACDIAGGRANQLKPVVYNQTSSTMH